MVQVVIGAPVPCTYTVTIFNLTQGTNRTLAWLDPSPANATRVTYTFPTPLPIFLNDQLELRIFSSGAPCYVQPTVSGNSGLFLPFPNSYNPQVTFTAHTTGGVSDSQMSGMNFLMDGDFVDPALFQVNVIEDCAILPVELIDFTVQEYNGDALLNWSTASEINNDYFLLKRSADGVHWETLGTVNGNGTTVAKQNYNYRDADPLIGLSYYQLEQVDFDGTRSSSPIVTFEKSELGAVKVFPNPTSGMINISTYLDSPMNMEVRIEDMTGRLLEKHTLIGTAGVFEKEFDMQAYPSGIYSIRVYNQNESKVFKLVKN
jgi:hypothetical protein